MQVGPLFACIIKDQFERLRNGDRFFFSHHRSQGPHLPGTPFPQGLPDVAKGNVQERSLGAILCDNVRPPSFLETKTTGKNVFKPVSATNPELDCKKLKLGNGTLDIQRIFHEAVSEEKDRLEKGLPSFLEPTRKAGPGFYLYLLP